MNIKEGVTKQVHIFLHELMWKLNFNRFINFAKISKAEPFMLVENRYNKDVTIYKCRGSTSKCSFFLPHSFILG